MTRELRIDVPEAMPFHQRTEARVVVMAFMSDMAIVQPIRKPSERRHMLVRVGHGDPEAPSRAQDSRQFRDRQVVVIEVFEQRHSTCCTEAPVGKRKMLGGTDHESGPARHAFRLGETRGAHYPFDGEIAADCVCAHAGCLDDGGTRAADTDV